MLYVLHIYINLFNPHNKVGSQFRGDNDYLLGHGCPPLHKPLLVPLYAFMSRRSGTNQIGLTPKPVLKKVPKRPKSIWGPRSAFKMKMRMVSMVYIFELPLWQGTVLASRVLCLVSFLNKLPFSFERVWKGLVSGAGSSSICWWRSR